ncbi:MAG: RNA polymerase sigma-54 factor [Clostridia bacterium]|nr:RNA polymerase sigma-54 factor [Clostridia bacterium]
MKLGYELVLEQSQKLVMTPELIQAIKILQFTSQELENFVEEQLLTNPVLENEEHNDSEAEKQKEELSDVNTFEDVRSANITENDSFDWPEYIKEREYDDISYRQIQTQGDYSSQDYFYEKYVENDISLTEYLMTQLQFVRLNQASSRAAKLIIEALDENGYLSLNVDEAAKLLGVTEEFVVKSLKVVQSFDPAGIGARNLKECLTLQLSRLGYFNETLARIINEHLEDIAQNHISVIAKSIGISIEEAQTACDMIRELEPKPGRQFGSMQDIRYIMADVTVEKVTDEYIVTLNEKATPHLSISSYYSKILSDSAESSQITEFLNKSMNSAVWLIKSIEQRKQTIRNVVAAIVRQQRDFFEFGTKHLKPMTLAQIADEVGIHESTVSRCVNGKYMQTPRGLFELKYFFTGGICDNEGINVASGSIKEFIKEIISAENSSAPYSDQRIVEILNRKQGIKISRRTVAKYRDELQISSSSKRKRY